MRMLRIFLLCGALHAAAGLAIAEEQDSARAPRIFFTDLTSGPNTGGHNNNGTILTIYGKRFGDHRGNSSVTVGNGRVAEYLLWSDTKIAVAIGPAAATGNVVVETDDGGNSNGASFTVRSGNIYCVSATGNDTNAGTFPSSCWATLVKAKNTMLAGDISYALDGVTQASLDGAKATLFIKTSGAPGMPIALVAYPGAQVSIGIPTWGDPNNPIRDGVRVGSGSFNPSHWVLAGVFIQAIQALNFAGTSDDWRVIGNEMTCPNGSAEMPPPYTADVGFEGFGCATSGNLTNLVFFGNHVHDTGTNCSAGLTSNGGNGDDACKLYHAVYWSTDSNHLNIGWNKIVPNGGGCRALQFHSSSGHDQFDLLVHDNIIHDSVCDGVNFATVDPSQGPVQAYNNVIYNAGMGPDPGGEFGDYACIYSADITNAGGLGIGLIEIFNNTVYNCGSRPSSSSSGAFVKNGAISTLIMDLRNNITEQTLASDGTPENYVAGPTGQMTGTTNLWFGAGAAPAGFANNLSADPRFASLKKHNFHLKHNSPAIDAGVTIPGLLTDLDGITRPQGQAFDLGAYEAVDENSQGDEDN